MKFETQTISVRFVQALLSNVVTRTDYDPSWLSNTGFAPELLNLQGARITMEKFAELYRTLAIHTDDETLGMFSLPLRNGTLKYLCLCMLSAPVLSVALNRFCNFYRLINVDVQFEVSHTPEGLVRIALHEVGHLGSSRVLALELMLMLVQGVSSWMIAKKIPFVRICFPFPKPEHAAEYKHLYPGPVYFNEPTTALYMDPAYMNEPIRQDQNSLRKFLRNAPMNWFYFLETERPNTYRVRSYLTERMGQPLGLEQVASALHVSTRTLARRLADEGSSFQRIKDTLRRDLAVELLNKTRIPVADIAHKLGFEDATAFNRAFRQWTGSAPGAYRKRLQ
ncbi:AraC family transcriptional regulator [Alcaligenes endophyticus]|uniref:AraC family transcriptional regulator n=1 Tax=Alcaligenes endophyticus TaxID=1929088 RepID=A0ABT8EJH6_9BURK|nr:AraC family transcriptional regulator [Alcaligenes endophyticus]MCX5591764.1 AraC family transcriptional regulator [Alcaligenes endophyticus]MDN4121441.1 AraC family transcriptional regulator [Alcaligenes endophyticus]